MYRLDAAASAWTALWPSAVSVTRPAGITDVNARGDAVGFRSSTGDISLAPGDPVTPLTTLLADGYDGIPGDLYPGVQIEAGRGISNAREVVANSLFGNNGGRLTQLVTAPACSSATCLRVAELTIAARNPSTCTPGATINVTATALVRNQFGAPVARARVTATLLSQRSVVPVSALTNNNGVARFSAPLGACEGTLTALVDSVTKNGTGFDRTVGVLIRNVIPAS